MTGTSWVASAAALMLDVSIAATLVLAFTGLVVGIALRRAPAATRHLAWLCALGTLLALPLASLSVPQWRWEVRAPVTSQEQPRAASVPDVTEPTAAVTVPSVPNPPVRVTPVSSARSSIETPAARVPASPQVSAASTAVVPPAAPGPNGLLAAALGLWGAGMLVVLTRFGVRLRTLHRFAACCAPYPDPSAFELLDEAAARLETSPGIHLLQAPADQLPTGPMTWGLQEPVVVLPPGALLWPPARMRSVLLHEVAHVQRRDWAGYLLANVVCAVYWFHPLAWWAAVRLRAESELACDDQVLRAGIPPTEYAHALVEIIKSLRGPVGGLKVAISMAQGPQIEQRLRAILDPRRRRGAVSPAALAAIVALFAAAALPAAAVRVRPAGDAGWVTPDATPTEAEVPATAPRDAHVAWGAPVGGLRAGLEWASWDEELRPGSVVALRVRLKNTGAKAVRLSCLTPSAWDARLDGTGRVTLTPIVRGGGAVQATALWLAPGKECFVPGPAPRIRVDPATGTSTTSAPGEPLSLGGGRYQVVASRPLMLQSGSGGAGSLYTGLLPLHVLSAAGGEGVPADTTIPARRISQRDTAAAAPAPGPAKPVRPATADVVVAPEKRPATAVQSREKAEQKDLRARSLELQHRIAELEEEIAELKASQSSSAGSVLIRRLEERIADTEEKLLEMETQTPEGPQLEGQQRLLKALKDRVAEEKSLQQVRGREGAEERRKLQAQLLIYKLQLAEAEDQLAAFAKPAPKATPKPLPHPVEDPADLAQRARMVELSHALIEAEAHLAELQAQYGEQHPRVQSAHARIAALKQQLDAAQARGNVSEKARLMREIVRAEDQLAQVRQRHRDHTPEVRAASERLMQLRQQLAATQPQVAAKTTAQREQESVLNAQLEVLRDRIAAVEVRIQATGADNARRLALQKEHAALQKQHAELSNRLINAIKARLSRARGK